MAPSGSRAPPTARSSSWTPHREESFASSTLIRLRTLSSRARDRSGSWRIQAWCWAEPMTGRDVQIGGEVAGYRIESVIGRGGMGVVYLAEHLRLKRKAALKVLAPELAGDER